MELLSNWPKTYFWQNADKTWQFAGAEVTKLCKAEIFLEAKNNPYTTKQQKNNNGFRTTRNTHFLKNSVNDLKKL